MKRKNYITLEKYLKHLKTNIAKGHEIELKTETCMDVFETILIYQESVYKMLFEILASERICSHCDAAGIK